MTYTDVRLTEDVFLAWLRNSKPRPVLYLGVPKDTDEDGEWGQFVDGVPQIAGFWNQHRHGAYALLSTCIEWVDGHLYQVPLEVEAKGETELWRSLIGHGYRTKEKAWTPSDADRRFAWSDDPNDIIRQAAVNVGQEVYRHGTSEELKRRRVEEILQGRDGFHLLAQPHPRVLGAFSPGPIENASP